MSNKTQMERKLTQEEEREKARLIKLGDDILNTLIDEKSGDAMNILEYCVRKVQNDAKRATLKAIWESSKNS